MLPLLTEQFMPDQEPIELESTFLDALERQSVEARADWRIQAEGGGIDKALLVGLLVDDLTGERNGQGRILAVEIKVRPLGLPASCDRLSLLAQMTDRALF
jgi:hypothetical protein